MRKDATPSTYWDSNFGPVGSADEIFVFALRGGWGCVEVYLRNQLKTAGSPTKQEKHARSYGSAQALSFLIPMLY